MAQDPYEFEDVNGVAHLLAINAFADAVATNNSGASAPPDVFPCMNFADETLELMKVRSVADDGWIITGPLNKSRVLARTADTQLTVADWGRQITATGTWSQTYAAVATLPDGWWVFFKNAGSGVITHDPNSTEQIDAAQVLKMYPGEGFFIYSNGSALITSRPALRCAAKYIAGGTLSNNVSDATNDIDIAAAEVVDVTGAHVIKLSALTKRADAAWAVGTNQGAWDTGSVADGTIHAWAIERSDTGVTDVLFSASASAPTLPANYDRKAYLWAFLRASGAIVGFVQKGNKFARKVPVSDVSATDPGTAAVTRTLSVPTGIPVEAEIAAEILDPTYGGTTYGLITDLDQADTTPAVGAHNIRVVGNTGDQEFSVVVLRVMTNISGQIRSRLSSSPADMSLNINTHAWIVHRGLL